MNMEPIERSETSANNTQTPASYPKETVLQKIGYLLNFLIFAPSNLNTLQNNESFWFKLFILLPFAATGTQPSGRAAPPPPQYTLA
jgi:hypothetical protein